MDCGDHLRICLFQYGSLEVRLHSEAHGHYVGLGNVGRDSLDVRFRPSVGRSEFLLLKQVSGLPGANPNFERFKA
jgi:hypothetical protein